MHKVIAEVGKVKRIVNKPFKFQTNKIEEISKSLSPESAGKSSKRKHRTEAKPYRPKVKPTKTQIEIFA